MSHGFIVASHMNLKPVDNDMLGLDKMQECEYM